MSLNSSTSWGSASTASEETSPCELIDGVPLNWSGRGTSHVDYSKNEALPLTQGRFLGYGMHGGVYETTCNGLALAWKRKYCSRRVGHRERREIEIIKRLQHPHVIRLVGTYTHGPFLGLLLWPVATCDLANLLEDVDWLQKPFQNQDQMDVDNTPPEETPEHIGDRQARLQALGISTASLEKARVEANSYLERTMGCIASAVSYLHSQEIKHKDLKPSNILLSANGLWVTDFGTATDFSILTTSTTEDGERGTPKYFAPEIAVYAPSGRAADIFSMGCIFLEVITLCVGYCLKETARLRIGNDKSFHANLETIHNWFSQEHISSRTCADEHMMGLVRSMIQHDPKDRPSADKVVEEIALINGLASAIGNCNFSFCRPCCDSMAGTESAESWLHSQRLPAPLEMSIIIGNTYSLPHPNVHSYTFFVTVSNPDLVEKVHIFLHQSFRKSHHVCEQPPFAFRGQGWGSFDISIYVVLRPGCYWDHPMARPVPHEKEKRMLPMFWDLNFEQPRTDKIHTVAVRSTSSRETPKAADEIMNLNPSSLYVM